MLLLRREDCVAGRATSDAALTDTSLARQAMMQCKRGCVKSHVLVAESGRSGGGDSAGLASAFLLPTLLMLLLLRSHCDQCNACIHPFKQSRFLDADGSEEVAVEIINVLETVVTDCRVWLMRDAHRRRCRPSSRRHWRQGPVALMMCQWKHGSCRTLSLR